MRAEPQMPECNPAAHADPAQLSKKDVLTIVRALEFDRNSYWIIMGAALVAHGVRRMTSDIDLAASDHLFEVLTENGYAPLVSGNGRSKIALEPLVTLYRSWTPSAWVVIAGFQVASLESISEEKRKLNREKDLRDVSLIEQFQLNRSARVNGRD